MRKVQRWKYYCDFCKKAGGSAYHIQLHESSCTNNPLRVCKMCVESGNEPQQPLEDLITALLSCGKDYDKGLVVLREAANGCPCCILAAIRQSKIQRPPMPTGETYQANGIDFDVYDEGVYLNFDFKKEMKSLWDDINDGRATDEGGYYL